MSWKTLIIHDSERISLFLNSIVVTKHDIVQKYFIGDLNCIIFEDYKTVITTRVLTKLANYKVLVIFCDEKYEPCVLMQPFVAHHQQLKIIKEQLNWKDYERRILWTQIVKQKINNQINILKINHCNLNKIEKLQEYISQLEIADITNREAHAAKVYFNELFGNNFNREKDDSLINSGLNYGYTIIRSAFCRAIVSKGLHPSISIFHTNRFDPFALADDLMEPFRPLIDNFVFNHYQNWKYFGKDEKDSLINLLNIQIEFEGKKMYITSAINDYIDQIINFMSKTNPAYPTMPALEYTIEYEL